MNILFVCRYNRFRSRVAEALFNHYNKNKNIIAKSAGTTVTEPGFPLLNGAQEVLGRLKIAVNMGQGAQEINDHLIDWADRIYVVADDVSMNELPKSKTQQIDIPDAWSNDNETLRTVKKIEVYIKKVVRELT
jgi:protein-tyrosine-phosphatase